MKKYRILYLVIAIIIIFGMSQIKCTKVVNVETETPRGTIAPVEEVQKDQPLPRRSEISSQDRVTPVDPVVSGKLVQNEANKFEILNRFYSEYRKLKQPRLAIFFNRQLSDNVQEWRKLSRISIVTKEKTRENEKGESGKSKSKTKDVNYKTTIGREVFNTSGQSRTYPGENWMWAFEEGFLQPFFDVKAKIVDRSTIIRLTSSIDENETENEKSIEMNAIKDYADLLIELLITRDVNSPLGYSFKATAKDIKQGFILASTFINTSDDFKMAYDRKVTTSSSGYKIDYDTFPSLIQVSGQLAINLMVQLTRYWIDME